MNEEIDQEEFLHDNDRVLRAVECGDSFVITRYGSPIARLVPFGNKKAFVARGELKRTARRLPRMDFKRFRADFDE